MRCPDQDFEIGVDNLRSSGCSIDDIEEVISRAGFGDNRIWNIGVFLFAFVEPTPLCA